MKKVLLCVSMLLFCGASYSSTQSRVDWWKSYISRIEKNEKKYSDNPFLRMAFQREAELALNVMKLIDSDCGRREVRIGTHTAARSAVALSMLQLLSAGDEYLYDASFKKWAVGEIPSEIASRFFQGDEAAEAERLLTAEAGLRVKASVGLELLMNAFASHRERYSAELAARLTKEVDSGVSEAESVELFLKKGGIMTLSFPESPDFNGTFSAFELRMHLENECARMLEVRKMLPSGETLSPEELYRLYKNPAELQKVLFQGGVIAERKIASVGEASGKCQSGGDSECLVVPSEYPCIEVVASLNSLRESALKYASAGRHYDFSAAERRAERIIESAAGAGRRVYETQNERVRKAPAGERFINYPDYRSARVRFEAMVHEASEYWGRCRGFLKLVSAFKLEPEYISKGRVEKRQAKLDEYTRFVSSLCDEVQGLTPLCSAYIADYFGSSALKAERISRYLIEITNYPAVITGRRSREFILFSREMRHEAAEAVSIFKSKPVESYRKFAADISQMRAAEAERVRHFAESRSVLELETLADIALYKADVVKKLGYAEGFFTDYALLFKKFNEDIEKGLVSAECAKAVSSGSIINVMKQFHPEKMKLEDEARMALTASALETFAGISALKAHFISRQVAQKNAPDMQLVEVGLSSRLKAPSIKIGKWIMNERNYKMTDRKAAEYLLQKISRLSWSTGDSAIPGDRHEISGSVLKIAVTVPPGWVRLEKMAELGAAGAVFAHPGGVADIRIAAFEGRGNALKEEARKWLADHGAVPVRDRWEEGGQQYLVTGKGPDSMVREVYAVRKPECIVILDGGAGRKLYPFMREKLKEVLESVSVE